MGSRNWLLLWIRVFIYTTTNFTSVSVTLMCFADGLAGLPVTVGVVEVGVDDTLRCQPARSRR